MILIADSGATRVSWRLLFPDQTAQVIQTIGINPFLVSEEDIDVILKRDLKSCISETVSEVYFYGAGVAGQDKVDILTRCFHRTFPGCRVEAYSDLLAAARCLCGRQEGIVGILGTGANTGFYDGQQFVKQVPAGGFILGDEGSGAYLGKRLLSDYLKFQLPDSLRAAFDRQYGLTPLDMIERVYRKPMPSRFLASFALFLGDHTDQPYVQALLGDAFDAFFERNMAYYDYKTYPVNLVGSVAFYFKSFVEEAALRHGMRLGVVERSPIQGLVAYHKQCISSTHGK